MTNSPLFKLLKDKTQRQLAEELDVSYVALNQWLNGHKPIPAHVALKIHGITKGKIKYYELRPDLERI